MAIALSQEEYWSLFCQTEIMTPQSDSCDITHHYPEELGQGFMREIHLREGLRLEMADYQSNDEIVTQSCDREHPLEYTFHLSPQNPTACELIPYIFCGSGIAPRERHRQLPNQPIKWISVHIDPAVFESFAGTPNEPIPPGLQHLIGDPNQKFYTRLGQATPAMQVILRQIWHCPYQGFTKRLFLESKVWELMALLLEQELESQDGKPRLAKLKPDDIDRLHQAKAILQENLDNPPSLMQLAHQVGLNECTLKQGFRQTFNTTVFGYLRQYRMEQAKLLLMQEHISIYKVAQTVGYTSQSRFANAFRKTFGINPKAFSAQQWY